MDKKYILCRPQGGLTDQLCQIGKCIEYTEKYNRILIVDNAFHNFIGMTDDLTQYFSCLNERIFLKIPKNINLSEMKLIFPEIPGGNPNSYEYYFSRSTGQASFDKEGRTPLSFDFSRDYQEELLVHHQAGDGPVYALFALSNLELNQNVANELRRRYYQIGKHYDAIHIRNTDVITDYESAFEEIKKRTLKNFL